jgi:hypothetical protein
MAFQRKEQENEDSDFSIGTIAGLEEAEKLYKAISPKTTAKVIGVEETDYIVPLLEDDEPISTKQLVSSDTIDTESKARISFKNNRINFEIAESIINANPNLKFYENNEIIQVSGDYIRLNRSQVEGIMGKITDIAWRMLVMNNEGDKQVFNDHELIIGTVAETTEQVELAQLNVRINKEAKENLDKYRELLSLTQGEFVEKAIEELVVKIKGGVI